jgi:hypothetical protein
MWFISTIMKQRRTMCRGGLTGRTIRRWRRTPIVTVTLNSPVGGGATYPATLAHELGHAITGCPAHIQDGNNLMSGGAIRNGTNNLSDGQISRFRKNPWT